MTIPMYHLHSRTLLNQLIECAVNGGSLRRAPPVTEWHQRVDPTNQTIWPFYWNVYCGEEEYMLPTEMAAFEFNPGPPLKVRFMDASNYWFDEPAWIPSPFTETLDTTVVDIPVRKKVESRMENIRRVFS